MTVTITIPEDNLPHDMEFLGDRFTITGTGVITQITTSLVPATNLRSKSTYTLEIDNLNLHPID